MLLIDKNYLKMITSSNKNRFEVIGLTNQANWSGKMTLDNDDIDEKNQILLFSSLREC